MVFFSLEMAFLSGFKKTSSHLGNSLAYFGITVEHLWSTTQLDVIQFQLQKLQFVTRDGQRQRDTFLPYYIETSLRSLSYICKFYTDSRLILPLFALVPSLNAITCFLHSSASLSTYPYGCNSGMMDNGGQPLPCNLRYVIRLYV